MVRRNVRNYVQAEIKKKNTEDEAQGTNNHTRYEELRKRTTATDWFRSALHSIQSQSYRRPKTAPTHVNALRNKEASGIKTIRETSHLKENLRERSCSRTRQRYIQTVLFHYRNTKTKQKKKIKQRKGCLAPATSEERNLPALRASAVAETHGQSAYCRR